MEYKASLDLTSKIISVVVTLLFLTITVYTYTLLDLKSGIGTESITLILTTLLIISIYFICYVLRPIKYILDKDKITIKRLIFDVTIDIRSIKSVLQADKESMKWTIRTFGNGGLFGYFGKFYNKAFGAMTWYATRRSNYIVLGTVTSGKIVITPDDSDMVIEIRKLI
jgi:hypothetical protein